MKRLGDKNSLQMCWSIRESVLLRQWKSRHIMLGAGGLLWTGAARDAVVRNDRKADEA